MSSSAFLFPINSTIVRFNKSIAYRLLQESFAALEQYAPSLGARWAEYLWFRIPRGSRTKEPEWLPSGKQLEVAANGRRVSATMWGSGPRVYLVHGWGGASSQLAMFVPLLLESGYSVVSFDALGHGASAPGPLGRGQGSILDFSESLKAVIAALGPAHAIIAHSLGSTAVARALRDGVAAERLVFLAPMADPARYLSGFVQLLGGGERIRALLQARIERRVGAEMQAFSVPEIGPRAGAPLLIFHDRDDRETSWSDGADIAWAWPGARLVTTTKLGHRRILSSPSVIRAAVRFIQAGQREALPTPTTREQREPSVPLAAAKLAAPQRGLARAAGLALLLVLFGFAGLTQAADEAAAPAANAANAANAAILGAVLPLQPETAEAAALQIESDSVVREAERHERRRLRESLRGLGAMPLAPLGM